MSSQGVNRVTFTLFGLAAFGAALLLIAPTGAATSITDTAGINVIDTVAGGPLVTDFVHLETTCGAACVLTGGDEVVRHVCPPANDWKFHWSGGVQSSWNGGTCGASNKLFSVHSNGFISFTNGTICSGSGCYTPKAIPTSTAPNAAIFGAWHDLYPGQNGGNMYAQIQGTTPNRVAIVEWYNVPWACWIDGAETFELKLFESDNHVEAIYLTQLPGTVDTSFCASFQGVRVGAENAAGTVGVQYLGGAGVYSAPSNVGLRYRDVVAPTVNLPTVSCGVPGLAGWCRSLTNPLTIVDNADGAGTTLGLGVKSRQVFVDGVAVGTYASNVAQNLASAEGAHSVQGKATDWATNVGTSASKTLSIDITPPALAIVLTCTTNGNGVCVDPAHLVPTASDALSGFGSVACTLDGSAVSCANGAETIVSVGGSHTFAVTATDIAGNSVTASRTFDLVTDTIAPVLGLVLDCTFGSNGWCVAPASLTVSATDETQLASLSCALDGAAIACSNGVPLSVVADGLHTLSATATDAAGNSASDSRAFKIDATAPVADVTAACGLPGTNGWCRDLVTLSASGSDATSGVASVACVLDGSASDCSTSVASLGAHAFDVVVQDVAGNSATRSASFRIDGAVPTLALTSACSAPGLADWCLGSVAFAAVASDDVSGLSTLLCAVDGADADCSALGAATDGAHSVVAIATDAAGNSATASLGARIDQTAPVLSLAQACDLAGLGDWCRGGLSASADASDATSGLDAIACALDDVATPCALIDIGADGA
ncbi:MAG TPA: hypothetical protein VM370_06970, partial [Candidatus Thermoplasmatota archaeon]|nr:hypothetical protein [Candidatus Thermoplasmatota archaeon]